MNHHVERTSPKGVAFVGSCILCGRSGLGIVAAREPCPNPSGMPDEDAMLAILSGPPDGCPTEYAIARTEKG